MLYFRQALIEDLPEIVRMLADDFLGGQRESLEVPLPESYLTAFREIDADKNNELIVVVITNADAPIAGKNADVPSIVGTLQVTFTPSISFQGGRRCTVESVRVDQQYRGQGIGKEMMLWAIKRAKQKGCISMQLTTSNDRTSAHRFYEESRFYQIAHRDEIEAKITVSYCVNKMLRISSSVSQAAR